MNNFELQKVLQPVNLVPITLETLRVMFNKSTTDIMDLSVSELASLQLALKGIVLRVKSEGKSNAEKAGTEEELTLNELIMSYKVENIMFTKDPLQHRHMFCINIPNNAGYDDAGYDDADIILLSDEIGIFHVTGDGFEKDESVEEVYFVF